ncbi:hypothetical protein E4T38_02573 [Aureobasidium subglaciale]|nr:hypothetical protein E4T38_02573 [Aureobasidium subglaciale]KAI5228222.1 hypothetical protein E4T40_02352 [Aureobasidium subglaciale]KAI5231408.1 hypothetical protein E4T41_02572 [Aureobasidium subglaciale]KAI5265511.1 hypothetical protein E4T46_02350 [Aureobasidium subglaciale]
MISRGTPTRPKRIDAKSIRLDVHLARLRFAHKHQKSEHFQEVEHRGTQPLAPRILPEHRVPSRSISPLLLPAAAHTERPNDAYPVTLLLHPRALRLFRTGLLLSLELLAESLVPPLDLNTQTQLSNSAHCHASHTIPPLDLGAPDRRKPSRIPRPVRRTRLITPEPLNSHHEPPTPHRGPPTPHNKPTSPVKKFKLKSRKHLNASVTSAQKAAAWAIKYREWDEDLHSCILENLERNSLNNRANIFYFFETLCDVATATQHVQFVRMMEKDILRIVDLVAPEDGSGAANVKVVRKVLRNLARKRYLQQQTVDELEDCIKDRDQIGGVGGTASPEEAMRYSNGNVRVEKRQVEQRIEEDRERHKRLREGIWAVNEDEFEKMRVESADVNQDDSRTAGEEAAEHTQYAHLHHTEAVGA